MNRILVILFLFTLNSESYSQIFQNAGFLPNGWFGDINIGMRAGGGRVSPDAELRFGLNANAGLGYMFSANYGIKADFGLDFFGAKHNNFELPDRSVGFRGNIQGIASISDLANFSSENFRLLAHAGPGLYTILNQNFLKEYQNSDKDGFNDPGFNGSDDMLNFMVGVTPQLTLSDAFSFCFDVSTVFLFKQSHYLDRFYTPQSVRQYSSVLLNLSLGIQYRLVPATKIRFGNRKYYY
jgi:hypothetical protein